MVRLSSAALLAFVVAASVTPAFAQPGDEITRLLIQPLTARQIGPSTMSGRISNLAVYEKEPRIFYAATASGGLWKTTNGGLKFEPVFEYERMVALGGVAVDQDNPDVVWVGTGEENSRNSSSWGDGVYRSTDGGKSWQNMGLRETRHISRIILHPSDKNTVYAGALGHLWGENEDRGLFKTTDGGKTWQKVLYVDAKTGVIDMQMDPQNPDVLYVAMWEKFRKPYQFGSGGAGSALYKTTDGGKSWTKIMQGFPEGDIGRIGLHVMKNKPNVLVATVEASVPGEREGSRTATGGFFKSIDGGATWTKLNNLNPRPFYFSVPRIDPQDENRVYVLGVSFHYSDDGGKTFKTMADSIHVDHHAMWINPNDSNHLIVGNDGGLGQSRDRGLNWEHPKGLPVAQFYMVGVDMRKPYWVYGGLQDNGTWGGPTQSIRGGTTYQDWRFINGGDGFHAQVDPTDWRIVYAESQGGNVNRHNIETGESVSIRRTMPRMEGVTYRFNWSTPIVLSPHDPATVWVGSQFLKKSTDRGDSWTVVSPDLTTNDPAKQNARAGVTPEDTGAERHCTIVTISESPIKKDMVWVGTDDGKVQMTPDGGKTWEDMDGRFPGLPANTWCSRVAASHHAEGRAYATFDGHRNNDYEPYIYVTEDAGKTWKRQTSGLGTDDSVYAIVEGRRNPDFLACGTERGLYISTDRGTSWIPFHKANGFPTVRIDDLLIHPRELDMVVATHGRALYTINVSALEHLNSRRRTSDDVVVVPPQTVYGLGKVFGEWYGGDGEWKIPNTQPGTQIFYYMREATTEAVTVEIFDAKGERIGNLKGEGKRGLNAVSWRGNPRQLGEANAQLKAVVTVGDKKYEQTFWYENLAGKLDH